MCPSRAHRQRTNFYCCCCRHHHYINKKNYGVGHCGSNLHNPYRMLICSATPSLLKENVKEGKQQNDKWEVQHKSGVHHSSAVSNNSSSHSFTAPPNIGPGRLKGQEANPYKSWDHMSHKLMLFTCAGCLCAGLLAGWFVEIDETKLKPKFDKNDIIDAALREFEQRPDLAATSLRVVFLLAARRSGVQALCIDESCAVTRGLRDVAGVIHHLSTEYHASTEDTTSLIAIAAIRFLRGPFNQILADWKWDRKDSEVAPPRLSASSSSSSSSSSSTNIHKELEEKINKEHSQSTKNTKTISDSNKAKQTPLFSPHVILHALGDLTEEECVALMACHAVGEFHEYVSGIDDATHIGTRYQLNNLYYRFLLEHEKELRAFKVERTEDNKEVEVLPQNFMYTTVCTNRTNDNDTNSNNISKALSSQANTVKNDKTLKDKKKKKKKMCVFNKSEIDALLHDERWRNIVIKYAENEEEWKWQFQSAFTKMIDGHFKKLRVYSTDTDNTHTDESETNQNAIASDANV